MGDGARRSRPPSPALVEAVARGLHRGVGDASPGQFGEQPVQRHRIGRGQRAVFVAPWRHHAGGADRGGGKAGLLPDLAGEGGDGGLAAGAGHRNHRLGLRAEETGSAERQRQPRIGYNKNGNRQAGKLAAAGGNDRHRSAPDGIGGIGTAIRPGSAEGKKQVSRHHLPGIGRKPAYSHVGKVCVCDRQDAGKFFKLHRDPFVPPNPGSARCLAMRRAAAGASRRITPWKPALHRFHG